MNVPDLPEAGGYDSSSGADAILLDQFFAGVKSALMADTIVCYETEGVPVGSVDLPLGSRREREPHLGRVAFLIEEGGEEPELRHRLSVRAVAFGVTVEQARRLNRTEAAELPSVYPDAVELELYDKTDGRLRHLGFYMGARGGYSADLHINHLERGSSPVTWMQYVYGLQQPATAPAAEEPPYVTIEEDLQRAVSLLRQGQIDTKAHQRLEGLARTQDSLRIIDDVSVMVGSAPYFARMIDEARSSRDVRRELTGAISNDRRNI